VATDTGRRLFALGDSDEIVVGIRRVVDRLVRDVKANAAFVMDGRGAFVAVSGDPQESDAHAIRAFHSRANPEELAEDLECGRPVGCVDDGKVIDVRLIDHRLLLTVVADSVSLGVVRLRTGQAVAELEAILGATIPPRGGSSSGGAAPASAAVFVRIEREDLKKLLSS
jgi:hypothetical protein